MLSHHRGNRRFGSHPSPSPGEGWGEGTVSDVSPCRGLAAQHLRRFNVWPKRSITLTPGPFPGGRGENKVLFPESRSVI
jgi:hypothetical protein